jgi:peptidoglycan/xylan/chitin deacetylase (PgdA/CDA1 family)
MRAIITYHSIDPSGSPISVSREVFRLQMAWLAASPVRVVPVAALLKNRADGDAVALTFDDGYLNLAAEVAPLLAEYGFPWTVFVVSDHVGGTNAWSGGRGGAVPELPLLDWDALRRLAAAGVEIGSHTRRHPRLSRLDAAASEDEVAGAAERIAGEIGRRPAGFAYPYGDVGPAALDAVRRSAAWAVTTELRMLGHREAAHLLPRLDSYYLRNHPGLGALLSPSFRGYLWARRGARWLRGVVTARGRAAG